MNGAASPPEPAAGAAAREERSRRRLDEFIEAMHDVVYLHDLEGRFLMVNDAACRLYGYTREELLRKGIQDIVDPGHLARARDHMRRKAEGKAPRSPPYEILTRTKQGRPVWMEVSSSAVMRDGRTVAIQGIARNVNERKANDEALRLVQRVAAATQGSEAFSDVLALACEGLGEATGCARVEGWIPDPDGALRLQAAWPDTRSVQEEKFHRLSTKADFVRGSGIAARAVRDGCPFWLPDLTQEPTFVRATAARAAGYEGLLVVPLLSEGRLAALLLLFTSQPSEAPPSWQRLVESIASQLGVAFARRQAYDEAARQVELLGLQMELAPIAMLLVGADGAILGANHRFLELCRLKPVPNLRPFDATFVSRLPDPGAFVAKARDIYESDRRGSDELRLGELLLKRFVLDLPGAGGTTLGRAVFLRDITEQRRAEDDLRARRELSRTGPVT